MTDEHPRTLTIFLIAAAVGLVGGLILAWFVSPVEFTDVGPAELRPDFRAMYLQLVGASFAFENDWPRTQFRLDALHDPDVARQVAEVTKRVIAEGRPGPVLRAMSRLSDRLGVRTAEMVAYLATPVPTLMPSATPTRSTPTPVFILTSGPTFVPPATPTPFPTFTPTPVPPPAYLLVAQDRVCEPGPALIRVIVENERGQGTPGVEVWVTWDGGADRFVTGLKPEKGSGYGDMEMQPGTVYAVAIAQSAVPVAAGLRMEQCPSSGSAQATWASWQLVFRPVPPTATPTVVPSPSSTLTATPARTMPGPAPTRFVTPTPRRT